MASNDIRQPYWTGSKTGGHVSSDSTLWSEDDPAWEADRHEGLQVGFLIVCALS
jgi:hypothetical protein